MVPGTTVVSDIEGVFMLNIITSFFRRGDVLRALCHLGAALALAALRYALA